MQIIGNLPRTSRLRLFPAWEDEFAVFWQVAGVIWKFAMQVDPLDASEQYATE
jgi:hypothetical protein